MPLPAVCYAHPADFVPRLYRLGICKKHDSAICCRASTFEKACSTGLRRDLIHLDPDPADLRQILSRSFKRAFMPIITNQ